MLAQLKVPPLGESSTRLHDAIGQASERLMSRQSGRKALIVLSDGMDVRSQSSILAAIEHAQRGDTIIYAVLLGYKPFSSRTA